MYRKAKNISRWGRVGMALPPLAPLLPARASEQGNVIGSVRERTRDLIYLKFVATDFFPKIISSSAGENSGDLA